MTLAVMGYHFQVMTARLTSAAALPALLAGEKKSLACESSGDA